jgi:hypothetical protein
MLSGSGSFDRVANHINAFRQLGYTGDEVLTTGEYGFARENAGKGNYSTEYSSDPVVQGFLQMSFHEEGKLWGDAHVASMQDGG